MVMLDGPVRGQSIGAYVRERRRANHLTQQQLAELAGVGLRFLKELEAGKSTVQLESVNAVLAVFGKQLGVVERPRDLPPADAPPEDDAR
jgi:y4mF family transcriptional regulator